MSPAEAMPMPQVVSRDEWLAARKAHLENEKKMTLANDALSAERRQLPMVKVDKNYTFKSTKGSASLDDLFDGKDQLIVYHFMFAPEWDRGCSGCTHVGESLPDPRHLRFKNTNLVFVSRAAPEKLEEYKSYAGWNFPWYSTEESDFNYDFNATVDETPEHHSQLNFRTKAEADALGKTWYNGDVPGYSIFYKNGGNIYHTYSTFARGGERIMTTLHLLDMTPLGRQDASNSPGDFKLRSEYNDKS